MPNKRTLAFGSIVVVLIVFLAIVTLSGGGDDRASQPTQPAVFMEGATAQSTIASTATLVSGGSPDPTMSSAPVAGGDCGADCMWSSACVTGRYTTEEWSGLGLTKVRPGYCIPLDPMRWFIRPDDPFAGMPCWLGSTTCVWSRDCVSLGRVAAVKNGLAPVFPGTCTAVSTAP